MTEKLLQVWGTSQAKVIGSGYRQERTIVAAYSRAAAARALGLTPSSLAKWGDTTGNEEELRVALAEPGQVFFQSHNYPLDGRQWGRARLVGSSGYRYLQAE